MIVGVVVPARDEERHIDRCLDALAVAAARVDATVHLTVVLDACTDRTAARCADRAVDTATTDADSEVDPDWLAEQLALARDGADAVLGVVDLDDPTEAFRDLYGSHTGSHPHVHGASMGLSLRAYLRTGGFRPAAVGEDVDLAERLDADPTLRVVRSTRVRVRTSDRRTSRVRGGFADVLRALDAGEQPPTAVRA